MPYIRLLDETGAEYGIRQIDSKPRVSSMPYLYDIAEGNVAGHTPLQVLGYNAAVGTTEEVISDISGTQVYLSAAEQLKIVSASGNDDVGGTGALTMQIYGLDTNYAEQNEIIILTGASAVTTVNSYLRIFKAIVRTAGAGGKNAGIISIKDNGATNTLLQIAAGNNESLAAIWTVPANKTFYMVILYTSVGITKQTQVKLYIRPLNEVFQLKHHMTVQDGHVHHEMKMPRSIAAKSDIEIRGIASGGGGAISAGFDGWYES